METAYNENHILNKLIDSFSLGHKQVGLLTGHASDVKRNCKKILFNLDCWWNTIFRKAHVCSLQNLCLKWFSGKIESSLVGIM